ncbi:MAG: phosphoglycerate dehydrogenase [Gammaproteobacteria bacterium]|nr:phosphoglycerate dehydrogenase [Gammaproteobacteria bacterium]
MFKVFVADKLAPEGIAALKEYPELEIDFTPGLEVDAAIPHAADADAIIVRSETKIRGTLLAAAQKLRVVGRAGIGVDNIDLEASTERGIVVLNTPDANATTTAELAIAHMFSLSRNLPEADRSVRSGRWERSKFVGAELSGKTVGIVGFGTIGRIVADRCRGLRMHVVGFDPFVNPQTFAEHDVEHRELDALLAESDYVTLHCPLTDGTNNLLSAARLKLMKKGARLINCARGGLVDEAALAAAVVGGHLAGAALDVFAKEPPGESPLFADARVQFTPHLGASTHEAQTAVGVEIAHQIAAFLIRGEVRNSVNVPNVAPEKLKQVGPYMMLARRLGRLLGLMLEGPLESLEVGLYGRAAGLEAHLISSEALVGLLQDRLETPVNRVNAATLARRQGIRKTEVNSPDSRDYLATLRLTGKAGNRTMCLEGTLFDERHPRLVRVNDYAIEAALDGQILLTRHADRPGVVGAVGEILGRAGVNITRMQVGAADGKDYAIAVVGISQPLGADTLKRIGALDAVDKVMQVNF